MQIPFPVIILAAAAIGAFAARSADAPMALPPLIASAQTLRTVSIWGAIWLIPLAVLWLVAPGRLLTEVGLLFAKLAVATFGGAYAVLACL